MGLDRRHGRADRGPTLEETRFVAVDFETADSRPDSACAVGLAVVEGGRLVARHYRLIRPPRPRFSPWCVRVHGLRWEDVRAEPDFGALWPELAAIFRGADFLAAHNASFDRGVLTACCRAAGQSPPVLPFVCTVQLARRVWRLPSNRLPAVCRHLVIDLVHHHAASDAEACARIAVSGLRQDPDFLRRVL